MNLCMHLRRRHSQSVTSQLWLGLNAVLALMAAPAMALSPASWVGKFATDGDMWQEVRLRKDLKPNRFERRKWEGVHALAVQSQASMSLMARTLNIDLSATPVQCWRWRVGAVITTADMSQRQWDDYAARVYVSFHLPESAMGLGLRTKLRLARAIWGADVPDAAINYFWDNSHPIGTEQPNVYTDRAIMVVQRSGNQQAGRWIEERRNVLEDVSRLFSDDARAVQLAVTADSDNTGETAHAGFADFHFVPADVKCDFPPAQP